MRINRHATFGSLAATVLATIAMIQCGGSSTPSTPSTTNPTVSSVALNATSVAAGTSSQGTVSLTAPATAGGMSVSLSSSNPAVATVQSPVTVPAGASSAAFTVTAMGTGTATITASLNGATSQSPMLTVTPGAVLSSISLSAPSVVGGQQVNATVTLSGAAPASGAAVSVSGGDPVTVPTSVMVPAGSTSATFTISTRAVGGTISATISASYGGASASAVLAVTRVTVATASFGVTGPSQTETCNLSNNGNTLNCTFDGTTSSAPGNIVAWDWTYTIATTLAQTTTGPVLRGPSVTCAWIPPPPLAAGAEWLDMTVTLKVHDDQGNVSAEVAHRGVRLLPQGSCGY